MFGFVATIIGALLGGAMTVRLGVMRALIVCGVLQSAGNLFYVLQAAAAIASTTSRSVSPPKTYTGRWPAPHSSLISPVSARPPFTATQYALLSSLAAVGRTLVASTGGLFADGWVGDFFLISTIATVPALLLIVWIAWRWPDRAERQPPASASIH